MQQTLTFRTLADALRGTNSTTQSCLGLVKENLYVGEEAEWISVASVNDFGDWHDGVIVVTDQRVFAAYLNKAADQIYGNMIARLPAPRVSQLQGGGSLTAFEIAGLPLQAFGVGPSSFEELREILSAPSEQAGGTSTAEDPRSALATAKSLLDEGLISQHEYDEKKKEILARL